MTNPDKVVTRFAPSPTGFMHVGSLRTALFGWLWARKNGGTFILRLEDTDKNREVTGSLDHIMASLRWLGLNWDEGPDIGGKNGPYTQSERLDIYKKYALELLDKGFAYADPYTEEEVEAFRKEAEANKKPFLYRNHRPKNIGEDIERWDGTRPLRFKTPIKKYKWHDEVRGELEAGEEAVDDFVLIKSDGYPTYNFAHIIDDLLMGVTHIFRADEFIASTPKFLALYEALGIEHPAFVTLPPILSDAGNKKLGKRDGAKDILDYKQDGYLTEAMFNFLAFIGWNPGKGDEREVMTQEEILQSFELEHIQKGGAKFNEEKLEWLNKEHMKKLSDIERGEEIQKWLDINPTLLASEAAHTKLKDIVFMQKIYPIIFDHISKWSDIGALVDSGELTYYFEKPTYDGSMLSWKGQTNEDIKTHLSWVRETLKNANEHAFNSIDTIKALIFDYATEKGRGEVLWPTRVSLSGKEKSPDPFTLIYILGKSETLERLGDAILKV